MTKKSKVGLIAGFVLLATGLLFFQNCSGTSFGVADSSLQPGEAIRPPVVQNPFESQSRLQSLFPEGTTSQTNQKVKALFVVDNSATMNASQTNLSNNIDVLLKELQKYDTEIQVVSTTYSSKDCTNGSTNITACGQAALFTHTPFSQNDIGDGWYRFSSFNTANVINTFSLNSSLTTDQVAQVRTNIVNKIKSLNTFGSDIESPFAVAVAQANSFFKTGDRGLIFIITDEDDTGSTYVLGETMFTSSESKTVIDRPVVPGIWYTNYGKEHISSEGQCFAYNEFNQYIGSNRIDLGTYEYASMGECTAAIAAMPNCSLRCQPHRDLWSSSAPLNGRTVEQACAEVTVYAWETRGPCVGGPITLNLDTSEVRNKQVGYALGVDEVTISTARSLGQNGLRDLYVSKFKNEVLTKLGSKYLISIMANVEGQSCALGSGKQTYDKFFGSIQSQFPATNFKISSICQNQSSSEGIAKVAADFNFIVNTKYKLNLLTNESVRSAKLISESGVTMDLIPGQDYKVENDQFVLLKSGVATFVRIDVEISKN